MAKYTTLVRTVCEEKADLDESVGFNSVDTVLNSSWNKIFTTNCTFFDNNYRSVLCKKILKHYYMREIGAETVGLWMLWMNTKLEEIMPYYNKLYESEQIEFNPMHNTDLRRVKNKVGEEESVGTHSKTGDIDKTTDRDIGATEANTIGVTGTSTRSDAGESSTSTREDDTIAKQHGDAYSDTPQSGLHQVDELLYLTNYRKIAEHETDAKVGTSSTETENDSSGSYSDTTTEAKRLTQTDDKTEETDYSESGRKTNTINTTEDYVESVIGNNGNQNFSKLLQDYRDVLINIDMMVIREFKDLFMQLW